jgi:hypothetical protein
MLDRVTRAEALSQVAAAVRVGPSRLPTVRPDAVTGPTGTAAKAGSPERRLHARQQRAQLPRPRSSRAVARIRESFGPNSGVNPNSPSFVNASKKCGNF